MAYRGVGLKLKAINYTARSGFESQARGILRPASWRAGKASRQGGTLPLAGLSIFRRHRFVVVIASGSGGFAGGLHPHADFPQSGVAQDVLDDGGLIIRPRM